MTFLNQSGSRDSVFELDREDVGSECMAVVFLCAQGPDARPTLVLERIDKERNMARYYALSIEPTLFGEVALTREWGRIGGASQCRIDLHTDVDEARAALNVWVYRKLDRGYRQR